MDVTLAKTLFVGLGGGVGAVLRYVVGLAANKYIGEDFPWGTMIVNVVGSFFIGLVVLIAATQDWNENSKLLLITGLLGGFTTFSAFSSENLLLLQSGRVGPMLANALSALLLGVLFAWAGFALAQKLSV